MPVLDPEAMDRIAQEPDLVLRNLRITQAYFDLSQALTRWTGTAANWCTFATWASKQAGQTIRNEDPPRTFERLFELSPEIGDALGEVLRQLRTLSAGLDPGVVRSRILRAIDPAAAFARASMAVSRGNTKVFAELAPLFARFIARFGDEATPDASRLAEFTATLRPDGPPDGQELLQQAIAVYHEARFESDSARTIQLILLGNLLIGQHEQTRLQPEILAAMNASLGDRDELRTRIVATLLPGFWVQLRHRLSRALGRKLPLDQAVDRVLDHAERLLRQVVTEVMMTLALPEGRVLQLGRDLAAEFPPELRRLSLPALLTLLSEIDPTPDSVAKSGTVDWGDLPDRMHFIADLFRCYGRWRPLFGPPFTTEQLTAIAAGRRPDGRL